MPTVDGEASEGDVERHEVIVIGGSYAGASAALQLARARRRVCVIDAGVRRNRVAAVSYGLIGHDGCDPGDLIAAGRAELLRYPTVTWIEGHATAARSAGDDFEVVLASGQRRVAPRLVLASGMIDELPDLPGLAERWGSHVFLCPYCHGYELDGGAIGVIAHSPAIEHLAMLLPDWGPTTLFVQDVELGAVTRTALAARGVGFEEEPVVAIEGDDSAVVRLRDGRAIALAAVFAMPSARLADDLATQLGCELEEGAAGAHLEVNGAGETSVAGVYACGDNTCGRGSIATAIGDGARAGVAVHQSLVCR